MRTSRALDASRAGTRAGFVECVQRGIASGELRPDTSALALAAVFDSFLSGVSISARDGVDAAVLDAAIDQVMRLWDETRQH